MFTITDNNVVSVINNNLKVFYKCFLIVYSRIDMEYYYNMFKHDAVKYELATDINENIRYLVNKNIKLYIFIPEIFNQLVKNSEMLSIYKKYIKCVIIDKFYKIYDSNRTTEYNELVLFLKQNKIITKLIMPIHNIYLFRNWLNYVHINKTVKPINKEEPIINKYVLQSSSQLCKSILDTLTMPVNKHIIYVFSRNMLIYLARMLLYVNFNINRHIENFKDLLDLCNIYGITLSCASMTPFDRLQNENMFIHTANIMIATYNSYYPRDIKSNYDVSIITMELCNENTHNQYINVYEYQVIINNAKNVYIYDSNNRQLIIKEPECNFKINVADVLHIIKNNKISINYHYKQYFNYNYDKYKSNIKNILEKLLSNNIIKISYPKYDITELGINITNIRTIDQIAFVSILDKLMTLNSIEFCCAIALFYDKKYNTDLDEDISFLKDILNILSKFTMPNIRAAKLIHHICNNDNVSDLNIDDGDIYRLIMRVREILAEIEYSNMFTDKTSDILENILNYDKIRKCIA